MKWKRCAQLQWREPTEWCRLEEVEMTWQQGLLTGVFWEEGKEEEEKEKGGLECSGEMKYWRHEFSHTGNGTVEICG